MEVMQEFEHPNIAKMVRPFVDGNFLVLVMNHIYISDLFTHRENLKHEWQCAVAVYDILQGLKYLHGKGYIHRDLKPENVLVKADYRMAITDFGFAVKYDPMDPPTKTTGTTEYYPWEMVEHKCKPYDFKVDIWCLGVLAYELVNGYSPFCVREKKLSHEDRNLKLFDNIRRL